MGKEIGIEITLLPRRIEVTRVDCVDDLQVPRENAFEQWHWPALQRFWQQCMISVGESADGNLPGLVPRDVVMIDKDAHQLCDRDARMSVIELDCGLFRKRINAAKGPCVSAHEILQRSGDKEIFLAQTQLSP